MACIQEVCRINIISLIDSLFELFYLLQLVSLVIYLYCANYLNNYVVRFLVVQIVSHFNIFLSYQ